MVRVELRAVSKLHGSRRTVKAVSVDIPPGAFAVVVGPSGCGKSTLLRMIAGLEEVSEGEIAVDGRVVNDVPAKDRDVAMVFQNYALYPHLTVAENMAFGLRMRRYPKQEIEARVRAAAQVLGLQDLLERRPEALSGGQRQRVAVGRAIVRRPRIFLFDEPLSNLDARLRVAMRAELIQLHQRVGATMIYVTHDQVEAMSMGDLLIVLRDGVVQQTGTPLEVYDRPANRFVAGFLGSPSMNFFEVELEGDEVRAPGLRVRVPAERLGRLRAGGGRGLVLGVRPEDLHERARFPGAPEGVTLAAEVSFVENLGSEVLATCRVGGRETVVRLPPGAGVSGGAALELAVDMGRARFFDAEGGRSLD